MTAVVAFLFLLFLLIPGCQQSCNRPPPPQPSPSPSPSMMPTPTATATPLPYALRNASCVSKTVVGKRFDYSPKDREEVHLISAKLGVDSQLIAQANHLSRFSKVEPGRSLHIDNQHIAPCDITKGILVNLPQRMLFHYKEDGTLEAAYPVAVGKPEWETPIGSFAVITMHKNPVWVVPKDIQEEMEDEGKEVITRVEPGPDNPLGNYWIGLSLPGIGIHATNVPASVYSYHTHGCVRLSPDNVKELFGHISKNEFGMIVYEPVLFAKLDDGRVFLEVDRDIYEKGLTDMDHVKQLADSMKLGDVIDWAGATAVVNSHDGIAHDVTAKR
jgi:L,D-transpeptidase ErfK/SrfK